jgi:hypothetical protein
MNEAEWRPDICAVTVQVVDAGFLSLIDNNKDIKAFLNVPRSKNDVDITSSTVVQTDLIMKQATSTDADTPADRYGVRVYDAFRFLIAFMSDGQIGFVSDYFLPETNPSNPTETRNPTIMTGYSVRIGAEVDPNDDVWPYISFNDLYRDINKLYNISFAIESVGGVPTMRIEPKAYFQQTYSGLTFDYPDEIKQAADDGTFYQLVKFGSTKSETKNFTYYPQERFQSWLKEEYHLGGQCNTSAILDLQLQVLTSDPNVIMRSLPIATGGLDEDDNDDSPFIVVFDGNNETVFSINPANINRFYYNDRLTNLSVANRYSGGDGVPLPIFIFLGANDDQAKAFNNTGINLTKCLFNTGLNSTQYYAFPELPITTAPLGYDPNGNIVQGTIQETCVTPLPATYYDVPFTGVYTLNARMIFSTLGVRTGTGNLVSIEIVRYNSSDVIQQAITIGSTSTNPNVSFASIEGSATVAATAGDKLTVRFSGIDTGSGTHPVTLHNGSFIEIPGRGLITKTYDPMDNLLIKTTFNFPVTPESWSSFLSQKFGIFIATFQKGQVRGFLKEANRNLMTGKTDWILRSTFGES